MLAPSRLAVTALVLLATCVAAPSAGAQIIFDHDLGIWAMNDDGSAPHAILPALSVPGMVQLSEPAVAPNGTALAFVGEWAGWNAEYTKWNPDAPAACGLNCEGVYRYAAGTPTRLSGDPIGCTVDPCASFDSDPSIAPDGDVLFTNAFYDEDACGSYPYWCIIASTAALDHVPPSGTRAQVQTPCDDPSTFPAGSTHSGTPDFLSVNPANPNQIAYAGCHDTSGHVAITLANRDGGNPIQYLSDDVDFQSVEFTSAGTGLVTSETGDNPGVWLYPLTGTLPTQPVVGLPANWRFGSAREISGGRIAFTAQSTASGAAGPDVYAVAESCTASTCTFPASATQLTHLGDVNTLTWTAQTVLPPPTAASLAPVISAPQVVPVAPPVVFDLTKAPLVAKLKLSATSVKAGKALTITYTDTQPATLTFTVNRRTKGRRKGARCVKPTTKLRHATACTLWAKVGTFKHTDVAGKNTVSFSGKVAGRKLTKGSYQLVAAPRNAKGKAGKAITVTFAVT